jgi:hypothetical protein
MGPLNIALAALAITWVLIVVTAPGAKIIPEAQRYNLIHGSAPKFGGSEPSYGVRIAVPPGQKAFPAELVPVD